MKRISGLSLFINLVSSSLALFTAPRYQNLTSRADNDPPAPLPVSVVSYTSIPAYDKDIWGIAAEDIRTKYAVTKVVTQLQGLVFFPQNFQRLHILPLLALLPGLHETCRIIYEVPGFGGYPLDEYLLDPSTAECDEGTPVQSHEGFRYLGQALAARGFFVVAVDPLTIQQNLYTPDDMGWLGVRARLLLRTLEQLRVWDADSDISVRDLGVDISGVIDFSQVGLLGHSRGGNSVRLASNMLMAPESLPFQELRDWQKDLQIAIRAVIEVSPTDLPYHGHTIDIEGVPWAMIASGCEEEIRTYRFYRIAQRQSASNTAPNYGVSVYGANHRYFNSQWHEVHDDYCLGDQNPTFNPTAPTTNMYEDLIGTRLVLESKAQQDSLSGLATAFFTAHVGRFADPKSALSLRSPSDVSIVAGIEIGIWNPNLALSKVLRLMTSVHSIDISPSTGGRPETAAEHAQIYWPGFFQNLSRSLVSPPNLEGHPMYDLDYDLAADPPNDFGIAIPIAASTPTTTVTIQLDTLVGPRQLAFDSKTTKCSVQVDVARRSHCYLASPYSNKHLCAIPRELQVEFQAGTSRSAPLPMKSRFNIEYGIHVTDAGLTRRPGGVVEMWLIPTAWETISVPCSETIEGVSLIVTNPSPVLTGMAAGEKSFLWIGPIRLVYDKIP